ncbi:hypothetical protein [Polyangium aurulentum]|uniref:hypothetical protein n=1 Tax=Polyangium aurulentum TaxID=2567896 RepID=UPI0010AE3F55|nr:hypothetical protein [Polyangium aurulentum]UQA59204.1 hypothetical protein E8A73_001410 [Polyangium aurulentum]
MARRILLGSWLLAAAAFLASTGSAFAQRAPDLTYGPDEVLLENGGMLRGTVVAMEPGRAVTLFVMLTGEQRVLPWAEVARVDRGKHPAPAAQTPADRTEEADRKARDAELAHTRGERGVVRVHIDSDNPGVQLYRLNTSPTPGVPMNTTSSLLPLPASELLCLAPCDKVVDGRLGQQFFFAGKDMPASSTFQVFSRAGALAARVEPGSDGRVIAGLLLDVTGACTLTLGIGITILGFVDADRQKRNPDGTPMIGADGGIIVERGPIVPGGDIAGPIVLGAGALVLVGGIFLGLSGETKFTLSTKGAAPSMGLTPTGLALRF